MDPALDADSELVRAIRAGAPDAPRMLWRRFAPMVFRMLRRIIGPGSDTEDLAQEVFLCVFDKIRSLRKPKALKAFIIGIADRVAQHEIRRRIMRRRWRQEIPELPDGREEPTADSEAREALVRFYALLDRLSARNRTLFVLRFVEEMSIAEIASSLGAPLATTKRHLARATAKMIILVERDPMLASYRIRRRTIHPAAAAR